MIETIEQELTKYCDVELKNASDEQMYEGLLRLVQKEAEQKMEPVQGRKLYYISAEFLIGCEGMSETPRKIPGGTGGTGGGGQSWERRPGSSGSMLPGFSGNLRASRRRNWTAVSLRSVSSVLPAGAAVRDTGLLAGIQQLGEGDGSGVPGGIGRKNLSGQTL